MHSPKCTHCKVFGHAFHTCKVRPRTEEEIAAKAQREEVLIEVPKPVTDKGKNVVVDGFVQVGKNNKVLKEHTTQTSKQQQEKSKVREGNESNGNKKTDTRNLDASSSVKNGKKLEYRVKRNNPPNNQKFESNNRYAALNHDMDVASNVQTQESKNTPVSMNPPDNTKKPSIPSSTTQHSAPQKKPSSKHPPSQQQNFNPKQPSSSYPPPPVPLKTTLSDAPLTPSLSSTLAPPINPCSPQNLHNTYSSPNVAPEIPVSEVQKITNILFKKINNLSDDQENELYILVERRYVPKSEEIAEWSKSQRQFFDQLCSLTHFIDGCKAIADYDSDHDELEVESDMDEAAQDMKVDSQQAVYGEADMLNNTQGAPVLGTSGPTSRV